MALLEKIADFSNLSMAFKECARGKRKSIGYQRAIFANRSQEKNNHGGTIYGQGCSSCHSQDN